MLIRTLAVILMSGTIAFGYSVVRKDGKKFSGELVRQNPQETVLKEKDGTVLKFKADQIDWEKTTETLRLEDQQKEAIESSVKKEPLPRDSMTDQSKWTGELISFDFKDVDIRDFFRFIADFSEMNLIIDPSVKGTLTMKLTDVPWDQALDLVCRTHGLGYVVEGNVVSVEK